MQLDYTNTAAAALWLLSMGAVGYLIGVTSVTGWTIVGILALLPPVVVGRLSKDDPSISESIPKALR